MASLPQHALDAALLLRRRVSLTAYPQGLSPILSLVWGRLFQVGSRKPRHLLVLVSHQPPACAREGDGRGLQLCSPLGSQGQEGMSLQQAPARLRGVSPPEGCRSSTSRASWA